MNDYKELIERLISASERNSNSLNTRSTCKKAADTIEQLVRERDELVTKLHQLEKERDAAVADFNQFAIYAASKRGTPFACAWCKRQRSDFRCQWFVDHEDDKICSGAHFEWLGVQEENSESSELYRVVVSNISHERAYSLLNKLTSSGFLGAMVTKERGLGE